MATGPRIKHCSLCKNHGHENLKRKHVCEYEKCVCYFCELTRMCQKAMRHQQRLWRHQKQALKKQMQNLKGQACDKCRNHDIIIEKKNHICPKTDCDCKFCALNNTRKILLKHQQRVRRANVVSGQLVESKNDARSKDDAIVSSDISHEFLSLSPREEGEASSSSSEEIRQRGQLTTPSPPNPLKDAGASEITNSTKPPQSTYRTREQIVHPLSPSPHENVNRILESPPPLIPLAYCQQPASHQSSQQAYCRLYPNNRQQCNANMESAPFKTFQPGQNEASPVVARHQEVIHLDVISQQGRSSSSTRGLRYNEFSTQNNYISPESQFDYPSMMGYPNYHVPPQEIKQEADSYQENFSANYNLNDHLDAASSMQGNASTTFQTSSSFENLSSLRESLDIRHPNHFH